MEVRGHHPTCGEHVIVSDATANHLEEDDEWHKHPQCFLGTVCFGEEYRCSRKDVGEEWSFELAG
jgi:hypothetical protein